MGKHRHYQIAYDAHRGTSFSPEKRAEMYCNSFDAEIKILKDLGVPEQKIEKYEQLWLKHMAAKSRCFSTMITGASNFNVARNDKANRHERSAADRRMEYYSKVITRAKRDKHYAENPDSRPILDSDQNAIERLEKKLASHARAHETMKAVNKILRKDPVDMDELIRLLGTEGKAKKICEPDFAGRIGFSSYALNNNRATIKGIEARIKRISARKEQGDKEMEVNGVKIVQNSTDMRIQLFFEGKPDEKTRKMLKSNAFKWAPSKGAWQRQLTNNAIYVFNKFVLPELQKDS